MKAKDKIHWQITLDNSALLPNKIIVDEYDCDIKEAIDRCYPNICHHGYEIIKIEKIQEQCGHYFSRKKNGSLNPCEFCGEPA